MARWRSTRRILFQPRLLFRRFAKALEQRVRDKGAALEFGVEPDADELRMDIAWIFHRPR